MKKYLKAGDIVSYIICILGVSCWMQPEDFKPLVLFFYLGVILFTALTWSFMVDKLIEKIKKWVKNANSRNVRNSSSTDNDSHSVYIRLHEEKGSASTHSLQENTIGAR